MKEKKEKSVYILDSFAMLTYLEDEPGAEKLEKIFHNALDDSEKLFVSAINLGEVYYISYREKGIEETKKRLSLLEQLPIEFLIPNRDDILHSAEIKVQYPISYADAFAVSLAMKKKRSYHNR